MSGSAIISPCGQYRYRLERQCEGTGSTVIVMVNPSTADATENDATIRKLIGFGNRNQWGRLIVGNLFAYRATDVRELGKCADPVGGGNDPALIAMMSGADRLICAWGPLSKQPRYHRGRWRQVMNIARVTGQQPLCIGEPAQCGHPKHPLMLPYASAILPWSQP